LTANLFATERIIMMGRVCLGLSLPLLLGAVQDQTPQGWNTVVSKEGAFKVKLPGKPMEKKQTVKTAAGKDLHVMTLFAEGRNDSLFAVSYTDYPEADLKKGSVEKRLDHARDGAASTAGGKPDMEKPIDIKGHAGRAFAIKKNGEIVARMHIYLVNRRLYQVMVLGNAPIDEAKTFLDSFALNE
jgi:hypothetical protein